MGLMDKTKVLEEMPSSRTIWSGQPKTAGFDDRVQHRRSSEPPSTTSARIGSTGVHYMGDAGAAGTAWEEVNPARAADSAGGAISHGPKRSEMPGTETPMADLTGVCTIAAVFPLEHRYGLPGPRCREQARVSRVSTVPRCLIGNWTADARKLRRSVGGASSPPVAPWGAASPARAFRG